MKKIYITLICAVMALASIESYAETKYCEVWAELKTVGGGKCIVRIDYGQEREGLKTTRGSAIRGDNGKPMTFESIMGGVNHLVKEGWQFVQAFGSDEQPHFIMKREE